MGCTDHAVYKEWLIVSLEREKPFVLCLGPDVSCVTRWCGRRTGFCAPPVKFILLEKVSVRPVHFSFWKALKTGL